MPHTKGAFAMHFYPASVCLPDFSRVDAKKWAVIACDQFTSEPKYWEECDRTVGKAPSALRLIFPEVWLSADNAERIRTVNETMRAYDGTVLRPLPAPCYLYVERTQPDGRVRRGLVGMIDLEDYDFSPDSGSPVRATEGTVLSRIPPRVEIRRDALYELPHIMLLCDDKDESLLSPYAAQKDELLPLYDTDLMLGGGHLRGWVVPAEEQTRLEARLHMLTADTDRGSGAPIVLAVGDGNHSLATAKTIYEEMKRNDPEKAKTSPARYALVEVVSLHSPALDFAPIYRLVTGCDPAAVAADFAAWGENMAKAPENAAFPRQSFRLCSGGREHTVTFSHGTHPLAVGSVQAYLDARPGLAVDYIHDEASLLGLSEADGALGFLFDGMTKGELFPAVEAGGPLPRKTFSMGHAKDKRYYMEARKIR